MPATTRSTGRGKRIAAANPVPRRQPKKVTLAQHMKRTMTAEGRESIRTHLDHPNQLMQLQGEFEMGMARLRELQRLEHEQKQLLAKLFKKMEGRAFQAYMKDEVVNLEEDPLHYESSSSGDSPPPGLAPLRLPLPTFPPRRQTPYPRFQQGSSRNQEPVEEELEYPDGCLNCVYEQERCANCIERVWGTN